MAMVPNMWMRVRAGSTIVVLVLLLAVLGAIGFGSAHHYEDRPLQPGGMVASGDWSWCTLNLVFEDEDGNVYMGTAAHCTSHVGERMRLYGHGEVGTLVFRDYVNWLSEGDDPYKDFALIKIDEDRHDLVDPQGRFWGGPSGVETDFEPYTPTMGYGQGAIFSATEPTRPRVGFLHHGFQDGSNEHGDRFQGWFAATHPVQGGDSGGFITTDEGKAIGVINWAAEPRGEDGYVLGQTFQQILVDLAEAGFDVDVVTSPFHGDAAASLTGTVADSAIHCALDPGLGSPTSNACAREPLPWPWDADIRIAGGWSDEDPVRSDWTYRRAYFEAFGFAVESPVGIMGVGTNAFAMTPGYTKQPAAGVTVDLIDDSGEPVFFTVCIHVDIAPGHCSEHAAGNTVASGIDQVTLRTDIPADTWVSVYVYSLFIGQDGAMAQGTAGDALFHFEGVDEGQGGL